MVRVLTSSATALAFFSVGVSATEVGLHRRIRADTVADSDDGPNPWSNDCFGTLVPSDSNYLCARFNVPLDWAKPSSGSASLALVKYKAVNRPLKGTIFVNNGGPGESAVEFILSSRAQQLSNYSGGFYDIVGFDPRGVGSTLPRVDCFASNEEYDAAVPDQILETGIEARGNFTSQQDLDEFYSQVDAVDAGLIAIGNACLKRSGDNLKYIGTTAVVRDIAAMADALDGKDKPINYWGFSYGTVIGAYLVNMFPNRVGKVIVDGVVDPIAYAAAPSYLQWAKSVENTEDVLEGFALTCSLAGPKACALAGNGTTTAPQILTRVRNLVDLAYDFYKAGGTVGSAEVRSAIFSAMYAPSSWQSFASELVSTEEQILEGLKNQTSRRMARSLHDVRHFSKRTNESEPAIASAFNNVAIKCSDTIDMTNVTTKVVFDELIRTNRDVAPFLGAQFADSGFYCHRWPARAVERFTGPFNHTLSNTIMILSTESDPITPYTSAKHLADLLGSSAILIEQDDYGHTSLAEKSSCTIEAITNYLVDNKLPSQATNGTLDKFCGTNQVLFPGEGITKNSINANSLDDSVNVAQDYLDDLKNNKKILLIVAISLAGTTLFFFLAFLFVLIRSRNARVKYTRPSEFQATTRLTHRDFDAPRASMDSLYDSDKRYDGPPPASRRSNPYRD